MKSDLEVQEDVYGQLKVTPTGTVRSWAEREEAEDAAWAAVGVRDVENELAVAC